MKEKQYNLRSKKKKPLFRQIEENYITDIEMPRLEMRKAELAKIRIMHTHLNEEQLKQHQKWYSEMKRYHSHRQHRRVL